MALWLAYDILRLYLRQSYMKRTILPKHLKIYLDINLKIIYYQNNYIGMSSINQYSSNQSFSILYNYFNNLTKLFSDLYFA